MTGDAPATARVRILRDGAERAIDVGGVAVSIGRAPGQALRIVEDDVAPEHAVLHVGAAAWAIEARAALTVDGAAVAAGARAPLPRGARIALGGWTLVVEDAPAGAGAAPPQRTASLARELVRDLLGGGAEVGPVLRVEVGPGAGQTIVLPAPPSRVVVGRGDEADAVILDADLSRRHAAFDRADDGVRVVDLGSKNGTRVGSALAPTAPPGRLLGDGDRVAAGATVLTFHDPAEEYLRVLDAPPADRAPPPVAPPPVAPPPVAPRPGLAPVVIAAAIAVAAIVALVWLVV